MHDLVLLVMKRRHTVTVVLRIISVTICLIVISRLAVKLLMAAYWGNMNNLLRNDSQLSQVSWGLVLIVLGIALGAMSHWLARWLVPLPKRRCPECNYRLQKLTTPCCPECGLELPKEFVSVAPEQH